MRYLLDTNIVSNVTKPSPSQHVLDWMAEQPDEDLFVASLTVGEIWRGIIQKPAGKKRRALEEWFGGWDGPPSLFEGRILPFDGSAALIWARILSEGRAAGRPRDPLDMIIASIAESNDCVIVTDNERHFEAFEVLNPLRARE